MKKIVYVILVIFWMSLIFMLSSQPADDSTKLSDGFISTTIGKIYKIFNENVDEETMNEIKIKYTLPIRKAAHFTLYMILGILTILLICQYNLYIKQVILLSIGICFIYAVSDEIHQIFVSGRSGEIRDVMIDICGSFVGIMIFTKLTLKKSICSLFINFKNKDNV